MSPGRPGGEVPRANRVMAGERVRETLARAYAARLAAVGPDGWPYVVALLHVCLAARRPVSRLHCA